MFNGESCVYILLGNDGSYYIGYMDSLERRLAKHQHGKIDSPTSTRLPIKSVYSESFNSQDDRFKAERKIKE